MTDAFLAAERLVRRFAHRTNLLIAGRDVRVDGDDTTADALRSILAGLGARLVTAASAGTAPGAAAPAQPTAGTTTNPVTGAPAPSLVFAPGRDPSILLDGARLPDRGDAAGRVDFAGDHMPVAHALAEYLRASGLVRGLHIGVAMVLEPKTAQLALMLQSAGAEVAVYAHPDEFDEEVAEVLRDRGVPVDGSSTLAGDAERAAAVAFLRRGHRILLDDGSHLIRLAHEEHLTGGPGGLLGAAEETTSGLRPLRLMAERGLLAIPVVAVNDAPMKTLFDNRYGTGQSCVFAIADVLDAAGRTVRDQPAVVVGYGPVGQGVAAHLRALGAEVSVAETDAVRALQACHDGYRLGRLAELAPGAVVVSATGAAHTINADAVRTAAVVAVAGGVPNEVDLDGVRWEPVHAADAAVPHLERADSGTLVIDRGGCVNLTAGEGNPIEIMDLSFAVQLAAVQHLVTWQHPLAPGIRPLPPTLNDAVARAAVAARGERIDTVSPRQTDTEADWHSRRYH